MKKTLFCLLVASSAIFHQAAYAQCATVFAEVIEPHPQSGPYNYFGIKVSIATSYFPNITVDGYIYDDGDYNTNHPFSLTIYAGNISEETPITYYQTGPTSTGVISVTSVSECPPGLTSGVNFPMEKVKEQPTPVLLSTLHPSTVWNDQSLVIRH